MKVRMKRDLKAAFDGITVRLLKKGRVYEIPESFAKRYVEKGIAAVPQNKAKGKAPENKAAGSNRRK